MRDLILEVVPHRPVEQQKLEVVERKGKGHPDTICDAVMESVSLALCREYVAKAGRVLHHNIDKGLLVAGQTTPALGGGHVDAPMRLVLGDRATTEFEGHVFPVAEIATETARAWFRDNLRFVDPQSLVLQNELAPGSAELVDIFARDQVTANDTSAAVGYAPLTETERLVRATETFLNSADFKLRFPVAGEDVKVLGVRRGRHLDLTIAVAMVDRYVPDEASYFEQKGAIHNELQRHLTPMLSKLDGLSLAINRLDVPGRGLSGMYLTVTGTSAEAGDGGQVGRGNRVNGLISLNRPMSTEAAAGKNPVSHVGKIYNLLAHQLAQKVFSHVTGIQEVNIWLASQIGRPVAKPWLVSAQFVLQPGVTLEDVAPQTESIVQEQLLAMPAFLDRLIQGELPVC